MKHDHENVTKIHKKLTGSQKVDTQNYKMKSWSEKLDTGSRQVDTSCWKMVSGCQYPVKRRKEVDRGLERGLE